MFLPTTPVTQDVMEKWRINVLDTVSRNVFFLGLPFVVINSIVAVSNGRFDVVVMDVVILVVLAIVAFRRSTGMNLRRIVLVSLPFIAGTYWLVTSGLPGTGRIFLLFAVILASLLFRKWGALAIGLLSIVTTGLIFFAFAAGLLPLPTAIMDRLFEPATMVTNWFAQSLIIIAGGAAIVITVDQAHRSSVRAETATCALQNLNNELEQRVRDQTEELRQQSIFLHKTQRAGRIGSYEGDFGSDRWEASATVNEIFGTESTSQTMKEGLLHLVHPLDRDRLRSGSDRPVLTAGGNYSSEFRIERADTGETRWVHALGELTMNDRGEATGTYGTIQDITRRKQAEQETQRQLAEKETLLQEVHHRIKNNMAQVESLLSIQASSTGNAEVKSALRTAMSRVGSIRTLYEKLLVGKEHQEVSMKDYLESLIDSIVDVFVDRPGVFVEKSIADISLDSNTATSVGFIINELLTNVFKYAFANRAHGHVLIKLEKTDSRIILTVKDDGIGVDSRGATNRSTGFGLTLTQMLAEQLSGTFTMENDNGTRSVAEFAM